MSKWEGTGRQTKEKTHVQTWNLKLSFESHACKTQRGIKTDGVSKWQVILISSKKNFGTRVFWYPFGCLQAMHAYIRTAPDTFRFLRHAMRAILSVRPKCSHRCVSLKESPFKPVLILKHAARMSTEQTSMRAKWFKHIAI